MRIWEASSTLRPSKVLNVTVVIQSVGEPTSKAWS